MKPLLKEIRHNRLRRLLAFVAGAIVTNTLFMIPSAPRPMPRPATRR
jgi:hypothetical protein